MYFKLIYIFLSYKNSLFQAGYKTVFDLVIAANTLYYPNFYKVCIKYLASLIKGKKAAEVGEMFKPAMQEFGFFLEDNAEEGAAKKKKVDEPLVAA